MKKQHWHVLSLYFLVHFTEQFCCSTEVIIDGPATLPWRDSFHYRTVCNESGGHCVHTGGECWPGTYCPSGASYPVDCDGGMYCSQSGLALPEGLCNAGFYCPGAATQPDPPSTECPAGFYCDQGSATPTPCPAGTFSDTTGMLVFDQICLFLFFSLHEQSWAWREIKLSILSCVCYFMWWKFVPQRLLSFSTG